MSAGQGLVAAALRRRIHDLVARELPALAKGTDPSAYGWSVFDRLDPEEQAAIHRLLVAAVREVLAETDPASPFEDKVHALGLRLGLGRSDVDAVLALDSEGEGTQ